MIRKSYSITKGQDKKVKNISDKEEISEGAVVRKAIDNL